MAIIYMKDDTNKGAYGKLETPIKMIIEHESDLLTKKKGLADFLFNIEKSNRFGETLINNNEFDVFGAVAEGAGGENDTVEETVKKFIEHIQFMKEFTITQTMMEDSIHGVAADAKLRAQNFTRAYYKTLHKLASFALANGDAASAKFGNATVDLTTGDGKALFATDHKWGGTIKSGTQSNKYFGNLTGQGADAEGVLFELAAKIRNMKDENGDPLGYTADTIIVPGNKPALEKLMKKLCGSDGAIGSEINDINLQYGNWNIVVDPFWMAANNEIRVMSSEANKTLRGNMLFNRIPLTIRSWVDNHTWNNIWSGRCRFGVGFGTYKHIVTLRDATGSTLSGYTAL